MVKKETYYIDPIALEKELVKFANTTVVSENLGEMFIKVANNLINKRNFINYTFRDEMIGRGLLFLCKYAKNFDEHNEKANGFAYVSQICYHGFVQCIKEESKHSTIKDNLIKKSMEKSELEKFMDQGSDFTDDVL